MKVRKGVLDMKKIRDKLSSSSFLKISGGKGYHVVVLLNQSTGWDKAREFAKLCAQAMEEQWPDKYTNNMRNGRIATSVAPYSLRVRRGAPISMPIAWDELDEVAPNVIMLKTVERRLDKEDPWRDFFDMDQGLRGNPDE